MTDYHQPDFYHFSEDSIKLAKTVIARHLADSEQFEILDLCAGSGVVALEVMQQLNQIKAAFFIEMQADFIPFLEENIRLFGFQNKCHIFHNGFEKLSELSFEGVIVCNPPYYDMNSGKLPASNNRKRCHFMTKIERDRLIATLVKTTKCKIYILLPLDAGHLYSQLSLIEKISERVGVYFLLT